MPAKKSEEASAPVSKLGPQFMYRTVNNYYMVDGERARHVIEREIVEGTAPDDFSRFIGEVVAQINTPMGPITEKVIFGIAADTVGRAFELFDSRADHAVRELLANLQAQHRAMQNQLVTPTGQPMRSIIQG